jgi:hypothetical protein
MNKNSTVPLLRRTARAAGKAVLAGLATCLLLAACADPPDDPPASSQQGSWNFPGPDNTSR